MFPDSKSESINRIALNPETNRITAMRLVKSFTALSAPVFSTYLLPMVKPNINKIGNLRSLTNSLSINSWPAIAAIAVAMRAIGVQIRPGPQFQWLAGIFPVNRSVDVGQRRQGIVQVAHALQFFKLVALRRAVIVRIIQVLRLNSDGIARVSGRPVVIAVT